jgi:hypothetical protein
MRRLAALIALPTLALSGCGGQGEPAGGSKRPVAIIPSSAAPKAVDQYDGAQRLVGALNESGIACLNWERTENPTGAEELGSCYVGTEEIVAAIYSDHEQAAAEPQSKADLLAGIVEVDVVVGGNWTLSCDSADLCREISQKFGGVFTRIPV